MKAPFPWHTCPPLSSRRPKVAVIGDIMLDRTTLGETRRLSPEAPVPVLLPQEELLRPGGAALVALNAAAMQADVSLVGVHGDDDAGSVLRERIDASALQSAWLIKDPSRPTTVKHRFVAQGQQLLRVDHESTAPLGDSLVATLAPALREAVTDADVVLLSDYAKGLFSAALIQEVRLHARGPIWADPKPANAAWFRGIDGLMPNQLEAEALAGGPFDEDDGATWLTMLRAQLGVGNLVVTRGDHGMVLQTLTGDTHWVEAPSHPVFDVTGAGDVGFAAFGTLLAHGVDAADALAFAAQAASWSVSQIDPKVIPPQVDPSA